MSNYSTLGGNYKTPFSQRKKITIAEDKAEEYLKESKCHWFRYGLDQRTSSVPGFMFAKIDSRVRNTPDYIVMPYKEMLPLIFKGKPFFLEAKGCKDILRLKIRDLNAYQYWDTSFDMRVRLFIYSTDEKAHTQIALEDLTFQVEGNNYEKKVFEDSGQEYYEIPVKDLF